ncbi:hypothetical protein E4T48_01066 [Aureobasidium sp. EXF-10727]|nr:hypothetical protein E4T48_01066 [Aureobasidium sp. EXF-10727]
MKIFTITAILWSLLRLVHGSSELCESFEERRYMTKEEAEQEVGPWFQTQFEEWESSHKATEPKFWTWFHQKYSPGTTDSILSCKLSGTCSPVHCSHISSKYSLEVQRCALFSLESVANFHNTMWMIKEANVEAWNTVEGNMQSLISQFSDGKNVEAMKAKHERHLKLLMHSIIAVTVVFTALLALVGGGIALGIAVSGTVAAISEVAKPADKLAEAFTNLAGATIRTTGSVSGLVGAIQSGSVALLTDTLKGPDYASKIETAAREANVQNFQLTSKIFDANMLSILSGNESLVQNSTLVDLVTKGQFANTTEILASYRDELKNMWTASAISTIWSMEHSYIVASDVSSGGCKSDHRGPQILKSCLDEYPTKVFYTYFKSNCREGIKGYPLIRGPPGHEFLKKATNFTLDDVVRSSMTHLKDHGNKTPKPPVGLEGFGSLYGPDTAITHGGGRARGLFTIPVCYTPGGQAISSINRKKSRNYPCACSKFPFSGKQHMARDLDHTELQARSLQTRDADDDGGSWPNDHPSTYNFFLSSGIGQSKKFRNYCKHYRGARNTRGNGCHRKNKIDWHWPGGRDGPKHPFHKCKSNPHKIVGCQQPNNDGWKQNKDCGKGKALGFDALVVDPSLEPARAVGGLNATWRNSSYATELPEYDDADDVDDAEDSDEFDDLDDEVDSGPEDGDGEDYQADEHVGDSDI